MSITVKNLPYDGLTFKINPVYNGLGFVVDSSFKTLNSFKYIAEIFVEGSKVGELRHNPDISNNNYGVFDIGRVVESYTSYDLNWNATNILAPNSCKKYYVRFGEEFSRVISIKSISNYAGKVRLDLNTQHALNTGDSILIQGITGGLYNGEFINEYTTITKIGTTGIICNDISFQPGLVVNGGYILAGETISSFLSWTDQFGATKVRLKVKTNTSFNVGDMVYIYQPLYNNSYRNVEWTVEKKTTYSTYTYLDISCPFGTSVPSFVKGTIVSRDNYVYLNQFSTQNHLSRAYNGVEQYENWLTWTPNQNIQLNSASQYLTRRPEKSLKVCSDDWMTLSMFGTKEISDWGTSTNGQMRQIVETWQTPTTAVSQPISLAVANSVYKPNLLGVELTGNFTTSLAVGDYVDISSTILGVPTTVRARIITRTYSSPITSIVLDTPFIPTATYTQFNLAIHAINNINTFQTARFDFGVGPKNLSRYTEIANGSAYKYFVYTISTPLSITHFWHWTKRSETWTFDLTCPCSKFKKWTVVWLNELGGFDFYNFDKRSDRVRNIERTQFKRHLKSYTTTGGYKYTLGDRGRTTYNVQSKEQLVLRTDFLNQEYIDWLQWAFESPEVYIIDNDTSKIYPVNCLDSNVELYNKTNLGDTGSLYIYEITLEMANNRVIQRGGSLSKTTVTTSTGNGVANPWIDTSTNGTWQQFNYTKSLYE